MNLKSDAKSFIFPNFEAFRSDSCSFPLRLCSASFQDIRTLYNSEKESLAKLAPRLTLKSCYPSSLERQNVKLVLKVIHESTIAALTIQNEQRCASSGLHLALSDPRTLGDVDFTIAHPNLPKIVHLPKKTKISIKNILGAYCAPKLIPISRTLPAFFLQNTHPDEGLCVI